MALQKRKTRMYEPWGYREENNYQGNETILDNDLESFFAGASYNKDDNKIYFTNKDGERKASLDVNEFVKSDSIIDHTEYKDGILSIYFTNGDVVTIDLTELLDENEFKDGLIVADHVVKVLIDGESDSKYVSVSENGVKVAGIEADIEAEKIRAEGEEQRIETKLDEEIARATSAETALDAKIDAETTRAEEAEQALDEKIGQEIADRTADVDAEETRATNAENALSSRVNALNDELDAEESRAQAAEQELSTRLTTEINDRKADVDEEEARAKAAEAALQNAIDAEVARATSAETALQGAIAAEGQRAQDAEAALDEKIDQEISDRTADVDAEEARALSAETSLGNTKFDDVAYDSSAKTITFYAEGSVKATIDTTDFVKDGMISDVKIEGGYLVITFNTDSGKENINIPLTDIFNPDNYYDKTTVDGFVNALTASDEAILDAVDNVSADLATETQRAISAETDLQDAINLKANSADVYTKGEVDGKDNALQAGIDANVTAIAAEEAARIAADEAQDAIIATKADASAVTESIEVEAARAISAETDLQTAIDLKADKETTYTKEEVDALLLAKENEIYNLTKIVGDMGGNVTYEYPNEAGKSLTTLLGNNGTVKLGEDATITRFGPGVTAKNNVKLNLNGHDLTSTSAGGYGAIMSRGTQEITIGGKGTVEAGDGICIEANGASSVINLTGSTTIYHNNRSGAELIYCYAGTINITNGTFRNDGENKKFVLNCYDANYTAGTAKIVVTGGKFYDFDPGNNEAEGPGTSFLAEGYHTEASTVVEEGVEHTVYTVKKDA